MRALPVPRSSQWLRTLIFLVLASASAVAAASTVYQWKDAKGVTHYSDKPPADERYRDRRIDNRGGPVQAAEPAGKSVENPQCATARSNLEVLQGDAPVRQLDETGKAIGEPLDSAQRDSQRAVAEAQVKAYCTT